MVLFFHGVQNFRLVLGGLSRCFTVPYPVQGSRVTITPEKHQKGSFCAHFSFHNSVSLALSSQSFLAFVLYSISALSYLPRARTSVPRRSPATLLYCFGWRCSRRSRFVRSAQSSGVTSHYSADSQARCPCLALQTPNIYILLPTL